MLTESVTPTTRITKCVVRVVNEAVGVCTVASLDDSRRIFTDVPWGSPFASQQGHMFDYCPTQGDVCYLLEQTSNDQAPSDDSPVILAWSFERSGDRFGRFRDPLRSGDIHLATRFGAKVLLDGTQGDLLVQAGPACGWSLIRGQELARLLCSTYMIDTEGGDLAWGPLSSSGEDDEEIIYRLSIKSRKSDDFGFVRLYAGLDDLGTEAVSLSICAPTLDGEARDEQYTPDIMRTPKRAIYLRLGLDGGLVAHAQTTMSLSANHEISLRSLGAIFQQASSMKWVAEGATSSSTALLDSSSLNVGTKSVTYTNDEFRVVDAATGESLIYTASEEAVEGTNSKLVTEHILDWLFTHTHPTPSGPSSGPLAAPVAPGAPDPSAALTASNSAALAEKAGLLDLFATVTTLLTAAAIPTPPSFTAAIQALTQAVTALGASVPPVNGVSSSEDVLTQETKVR